MDEDNDCGQLGLAPARHSLKSCMEYTSERVGLISNHRLSPITLCTFKSHELFDLKKGFHSWNHFKDTSFYSLLSTQH